MTGGMARNCWACDHVGFPFRSRFWHRLRVSDELSVDSILGPGGAIARRLNGYEPREQQMQMAREVAAALKSDSHLIAEAGTGTGKSFAYLIPAILHATENQTEVATDEDAEEGDDAAPTRRRRVVISTHTIALQEQLIDKDVPLLNAVIPREFSAVLVKGRSNYISIRRLDRAIAKSASLLATDAQHSQLRDQGVDQDHARRIAFDAAAASRSGRLG